MPRRTFLMEHTRRPVWRFIASLTIFAACQPGPAAPTAAAATPAITPGVQRPPAKQSQAQNFKVTDRAWWNQTELVKALQLKDAQRAKMDGLLMQALDNQRTAQQKQHDPQTRFEAALAKGDWDAAR